MPIRRWIAAALTLGTALSAALAPSPGSASAWGAARRPGVAAAAAPGARPTVRPAGVSGAGDDGADPLPTNPISPVLVDVAVDGAEARARAGDRRAASGALDAALAERERLARRLVDLAAAHAREVAARAAADAAVARATGVLRAAVAARTVAEDRVAAAQRALDRERRQLSTVAVGLYIGGNRTSDAWVAVLGATPGERTRAGRRRVLSGAVSDAQVAAVRARARTVARARTDLDAARRTEARARRDLDDRRTERAAAAAAVQRNEADTAATYANRIAQDSAITSRRLDLAAAERRLSAARLRATVSGQDFQLVALDAWVKAAAAAPCRIGWWAMAGISEVESHHGQYGGGHLDARGRTTVPIRGPRLDGSPGMARITDTDGGVLDGDPVFDRAVGPMQFIPSTWRRWAIDGDGDAKTDPDDIYDVARTAAAYLCAGRPDLTSELALTAAYLSYNQSSAYATAVLGFARQFESSLTVPG